MTLRLILAKIFTNLLWFPFKLLIFIFFNYRVEGKENLVKVNTPLLIVNNHTSWCDPFLVVGAFPVFSKLLPVNYAAWYKHYWKPWFLPVMFLTGAFPVKKGVGLENTLAYPLKILKNGGVVGIFPEEKRRHFGRPRRGRRGAAWLALNSGCQVLPIKVEGSLGLNLFNFLFGRKKIVVKVGEPFKVDGKLDDIDGATEFIVERLRTL